MTSHRNGPIRRLERRPETLGTPPPRGGQKGGMDERCIRKLMGRARGSPGDWEELTRRVTRPETDENGRRYDEWDGERGSAGGVTKVKEVLPQGGSLTTTPACRGQPRPDRRSQAPF